MGSSNRKQSLLVPRYLAYALPHKTRDVESRVEPYADLELHDVPLGAHESFLDFEGVVTFAGAFEERRDDRWSEGYGVTCRNPDELDLRERQLVTGLQRGLTVIFLVPALSEHHGYQSVDSKIDLFRRILDSLDILWQPLGSPVASVKTSVSEFEDFIGSYGTAYAQFVLEGPVSKSTRPLCAIKEHVFGFCIWDRVFILPCVYPDRHSLAVQMAVTAIRAARNYRRRVRKAFPDWIAEYRFAKEAVLAAQAEELRSKLLSLETDIDTYKQHKGVLFFQSDPLVHAIAEVLHCFFDIDLDIDDKCIDDAVLKNEGTASIEAVFEIKGVKGNFGRVNVNQVDSHRERLELPSSIPGILIMNTFMSAKSLADKDQPPHPDIIKKAVSDNVLLIRTFDLLKCADLCQSDKLSKAAFRTAILSGGGWLKAGNDGIKRITR